MAARTGRSMYSPSLAVDLLNGSDLDGRRIEVKYDKFA